VTPAPDMVTEEQLERREVVGRLLERYRTEGDPRAVEEALQLIEDTIPELDLAPELRGHYRNAEARAFILRYRHTSDPAELLRAVSILEAAEDELAPDSTVRLDLLSNLAMALGLLYKRRGNFDDLRRAVETDERVLELTPPQSPDYWEAQRNVAANLVRVSTYNRDPLLLERAIGLLGSAVAAVPPGGDEHTRLLSATANARFVRFQTFGSYIDLHMARTALEEAIAATKFGSDQRSVYLESLGWILLNVFRSSRVPELADLDGAVRAFENALAPTSPTSPERAARAWPLAVALATRFDRTGNEEDLARALDLFRESATRDGSGAEVRLNAAIVWGRFATRSGGPREAVDAWNEALDVMGELFALQVGRTDKETWLWRAEGVPPEAALARARVRDPEGAAVALDTGRAMLLVEALSLRSAETDRLERAGHGDLCARYLRAAERLDAADAAFVPADLPIGGPLGPLKVEGGSVVARRA
jgi:hypothetical protein